MRRVFATYATKRRREYLLRAVDIAAKNLLGITAGAVRRNSFGIEAVLL